MENTTAIQEQLLKAKAIQDAKEKAGEARIPEIYCNVSPVSSLNAASKAHGNLPFEQKDVWISILRNLNDINDLRAIQLTCYSFWKYANEDRNIQVNFLKAATNLNHLSNEQKAHLNSKRIQELVQYGKITVNQLFKEMGFLPIVQPFNSHFFFANRQVDLNLVVKAFTLGCLVREVRYSWLSQLHIDALEKGLFFESIVGLNSSQLKAMIIPALNLTRKEVEGLSFSERHLELLESKKFVLEQLKGLSENELEALSLGFSLEDVKQKWFGFEHNNIVKSKMFSIDEVRGLNSNQLIGVYHGYSLEKLKETSHDLSPVEMGSICEYNPKEFDSIIKLKSGQRAAYFTGRLTFEQVTHPNYSDAAFELVSSYGYCYDELLKYPKHQVESCHSANESGRVGLSISEFKDFTPLHLLAFKLGFCYEQICTLSGAGVLDILMKPQSLINSNIAATDISIQEVFGVNKATPKEMPVKQEVPTSNVLMFSSRGRQVEQGPIKSVEVSDTAEDKPVLKRASSAPLLKY